MFCPLTIQTGRVRECSDKCAWRSGNKCAILAGSEAFESMAMVLQSIGIMKAYEIGEFNNENELMNMIGSIK